MRPISTGGNGFARRMTDSISLIRRHRIQRPLMLLACTVALTASSGCVYRMAILQGNYLEGRTVDQLQVGMTRAQVRYLLGTPLVADPFDKDRWDYLFYFKFGRTASIDQRHLVVYFKEDKVDKFEKDNVPAAAPESQPMDKPPQEEQAPIAKFPKI